MVSALFVMTVFQYILFMYVISFDNLKSEFQTVAAASNQYCL